MRRLWPHALILLTLCVLFWPWIRHGHVALNADWANANFLPWRAMNPPPPKNPELDDPVLDYPMKLQWLEAIRQGEWPLWNPMVLCGAPLFEDQLAMPLCPFNLFFFMMHHLDAWTLMLLAQLAVAGLGMLWFLRERGLRRRAAVTGAAVFMLCNVFGVNMQWYNYVGSFCWLPLACLAIERLARQPERFWIAVGALAMGGQFTSGMVQLSLYFLLACTWLMVARLWQRKGTAEMQPLLRAYAWLMLLGLGMGLVIVLPVAQLLAETQRAGGRYGTWYRLPTLATYLHPDIFGHPVQGDYIPILGSYLQHFSGSIGLWPLMLAFPGRHWTSERKPYVMLAMLVPLYTVLTGFETTSQIMRLIPGFFVVDHMRAAPLFCFSAACLAAWSFNDLLDDPQRFKRTLAAWVWMMAALAIAVVLLEGLRAPDSWPFWLVLNVLRERHGSALLSPNLAFPFILGLMFLGWGRVMLYNRPALWSAGVIVVCTMQMLTGAILYNPFVPKAAVFPMTAALQWLQQHADGRILVQEPPDAIRGRTGILPPNLALPYGLMDVRGYCGLYINRHRSLVNPKPANYFGSVGDIEWAVVDLMAVRHVLTSVPIVSEHWQMVYQGEILIYQNTHDAPRAFVTSQWEYLPREQIVQRMQSRGPVTTALLEPSAAPLFGAPPTAPRQFKAARITQSGINRVVVETDTDFDGCLVLADTMYPGWSATVDGEPVAIHHAFSAFRAVKVPAGRHTVEFRYAPRLIQVTAAVSGVCFVVALLLLIPRRLSRPE